MHRILGAGAVALALIVPVVAVAQGQPPAPTQSWEQKSCADPWRPEPDAPLQTHMRWQAYHNLDCAMAMIDDHIGAPGAGGATSEHDPVTMSREDLEELRRLILLGKDAALRIER